MPDAEDDRDVRDVEDVPIIAEGVQREEIGHRPVDRPVERVAERAADDEADREGVPATPLPGQPEPKTSAGDEIEDDEHPAPGSSVLLEEPVGDAGVPDHDEVEEGRHLDDSALGEAIDVERPVFVRLVDGEDDERGREAQRRRRAPCLQAPHHAARSISRSASASRGVTSG